MSFQCELCDLSMTQTFKKQKWTDVVMEIDHGNENSKR
jgi:hypothetical protein